MTTPCSDPTSTEAKDEAVLRRVANAYLDDHPQKELIIAECLREIAARRKNGTIQGPLHPEVRNILFEVRDRRYGGAHTSRSRSTGQASSSATGSYQSTSTKAQDEATIRQMASNLDLHNHPQRGLLIAGSLEMITDLRMDGTLEGTLSFSKARDVLLGLGEILAGGAHDSVDGRASQPTGFEARDEATLRREMNALSLGNHPRKNLIILFSLGWLVELRGDGTIRGLLSSAEALQVLTAIRDHVSGGVSPGGSDHAGASARRSTASTSSSSTGDFDSTGFEAADEAIVRRAAFTDTISNHPQRGLIIRYSLQAIAELRKIGQIQGHLTHSEAYAMLSAVKDRLAENASAGAGCLSPIGGCLSAIGKILFWLFIVAVFVRACAGG